MRITPPAFVQAAAPRETPLRQVRHYAQLPGREQSINQEKGDCMKKHAWFVGVMFAVALFGCVAYAQMVPERIVAYVPFAFYVGKTELPAGHYEVYPQNDQQFDLVMRNLNTGQALYLPVITRVGLPGNGKAELVFDKVDQKEFLSEVRPVIADGFEVGRVPSKHTHVTVKSS